MSEREKEEEEGEEEGEEERQILLVQRTDLNLPYFYLKMFPLTVELRLYSIKLFKSLPIERLH